MPTTFKTFAVAASIAAMAAAATTSGAFAQTGSGPGSIINCDASGSRQGAGAVIGALAGAALGNNVSKDKSAPLIGGLAGAAAGSYIGCQQQSTQAAARGLGNYTATANVNVRTGPSTRNGRVTQVRAGERVRVLGWDGEWARVLTESKLRGYMAAAYLRPTG